MPKPEIMTAEQGFIHAMNTYPSLYRAKTVEEAKLQYFDHIFNVLGNGYRDTSEFLEGHRITEDNKNLLATFPSKYIGDTPLFQVYTEVEERDGYQMPVFSSALDELYTQTELKDLPQIAKAVPTRQHYNKANPDKVFCPYPNFKKQYSMVWDSDIQKLDISWLKAAQNYYQHMKDFFHGPSTHLYSYACPLDEVELQKSIEDMDSRLKEYRKVGMSEVDYRAAVSKAYECEYTGDTKLFLRERWSQELTRIQNFIDETLEHLDSLCAAKDKKPNLQAKMKK